MTRIRFEDLPSTNTPRNAENLNKLNNVVISSTEPNTGEEVWIQRGKNLLNTPYTENNKLTHTATRDDDYNVTDYYAYLEEGEVYTLNCESDASFGHDNGDTVELFLLKDKDYDDAVGMRSKPFTFTAPVTGKYFLRYDVNQNGKTHSFWNFQLETGREATSYEPYIEKKIYTKNYNNTYEKLLNADNTNNQQNYSTNEQKIGTWIDGKPLYRKTFLLENTELPANGDGTIYELTLMDLSNIDHIDLSKFHVKAGVDSSSIYTTTIMQNTYFGDDNYFYVRGFTNNLLIQTNYWKYIHKGCITLEYTKTTA